MPATPLLRSGMKPNQWHTEIDWRLQNALTLSAPVIKWRLKNRLALEQSLTSAQTARLRALAKNYNLAGWEDVCTHREYMLNLHVLDVCDRYGPPGAESGRALDIGAADWSYLPALRSWGGTAWDGIELNAHRRDWTLATRRAYAQYMCRICEGCHYLCGSLLGLDRRYACITWFLPYVLSAPLRHAHLPERYFEPRRLLAHAWSLLQPGGSLFVVNQGDTEAGAQRQLFAQCGIDAQFRGELHGVFSPFKQPRFGWVAIKTA